MRVSNRAIIFFLATACLFALVIANCEDNPLRMTMEYSSPVNARNSELPRKLKVDVSSEHFLTTPVTQKWNGICPTLNYLDTCCDKETYQHLGEQLGAMKTYMDEVRDDMTLVVQRGVFSLNFFYWMLKKVVNIILQFVSEYMSEGQKASLQQGFNKVVRFFDHIVNIITIILDFTPQLVDYEFCEDYNVTCNDLPKKRQDALSKCNADPDKKCDALEADFDKRAKSCEEGKELAQVRDCGSISRCWDGVLNTAVGHVCLACTPKWKSGEPGGIWAEAITCEGKDCVINVDSGTGSKLIENCQDFALLFFPNMMERVFAYIISDWIGCKVSNPKQINGTEVGVCLTNHSADSIERLFLTAVKWLVDRMEEMKGLVAEVVSYDVLNIKDVLISNYLFKRAQGFDISMAFADHFDSISDWGMFFLPSILLDVNEWLWDKLFEWTKSVFSSSVAQMIFDALLGFLVEEFHADEPSIAVPFGVPGYGSIVGGTAEKSISVYEASMMPATHPRLTSEMWAASRGGVAPYLPTQSVFRTLEARGVLRPEDFRRPNGVSLDRLRQIGWEEEVEAAIAEANAEAAALSAETDSGVRTQGSFKTTITGEYTFTTRFVSGGYDAWKYGACTGIVSRFSGDCTEKTSEFESFPDMAKKILNNAKDFVAKTLNVSQDMALYIICGVIGLLVLILILLCCRKPKYPQLQGNYSGYSYY